MFNQSVITTQTNKFINNFQHRTASNRTESYFLNQLASALKVNEDRAAARLPQLPWTCQHSLVNPELRGSPTWIFYSTLATFQSSRKKCSLASWIWIFPGNFVLMEFILLNLPANICFFENGTYKVYQGEIQVCTKYWSIEINYSGGGMLNFFWTQNS